jgi:hypothetical protein
MRDVECGSIVKMREWSFEIYKIINTTRESAIDRRLMRGRSSLIYD